MMDYDEGQIYYPLLGHLSNVFRTLGGGSTTNEEPYDDYGCSSSSYGRALGGGGGALELSFSVFSVAVMTLALLLCVELSFHRLKHDVEDKEFYHEVVDTLFRELATLGIVEFAIYALHTYLPEGKFPSEQEGVFARIHFLLFYTAIINALQSCVLFIMTGRHIENMWVRNEKMDFNHYVDIRREFDSVEKNLDNFHEMRSSSRAEEEFSFSRLLGSVMRYIRHPGTVKKYEGLLVPIRFHDLRKHFIDANDLPKKFFLSAYLKSCSMSVSLRLIHISYFAWLALLGLFNFLYFAGGMIEYLGFNFGLFLIWMFVLNCVVSVFISMVIMQKMKGIFHKIMYWKFIDRKSESHTERDITRRGNTDQIDLFWDSNPPLIIHMSQLIQFLYALSISTVLIFEKEIVKYDILCIMDLRGELPIKLNHILMIITLGSYMLFVTIIAKVMPRYILCTSSGQLVDKPRLKECVAKFTLKAALERREKCEGEVSYIEPHILKALSISSGENKKKKRFGLSLKIPEFKKTKQNSSLDMSMAMPSSRYETDGDDGESNGDSFNLGSISELVMMDTKNLTGGTTQDKTEERRNRRKTVSEGVAAMRKVTHLDDLTSRKSSTEKGRSKMFLDDMGSGPAQPRRRLRKAMSDGVATMRTATTFTGSDGIKPTGEAQTRLGKNEGSKEEPFGATLKSVGGGLGAVLEGIPARSVARTVEAFPPLKVADRVANLKPSRAVSESSILARKGDTPGFVSKDEFAIPARSFARTVEPFPSPKVADKVVTLKPLSDVSKSNVLSRKGDTQSFVSTDGFDDDDSKSDSEDIPEAQSKELRVIEDERKFEDARKLISWSEKFRNYFVSGSYKYSDGLLGTMVCFWLIGQRMDILLVASDIVSESPNTLELGVSTAFWWEFGMLSIFVTISIFTFFLFFVFNRGVVTSTYCLASFFDVIISSACLFLLIFSEVQRGSSHKFGHRTSGGVGYIEPFTCLIVFRSFRFLLARRISLMVKSYQGRLGNSHAAVGDIQKSHLLHEEKGTIVQLWQKALDVHPGIVEKYGEFSGELLQTMLGITILKKELKPLMQKSETATGSHAGNSDSRPGNQVTTTVVRNGGKILHNETSNNLPSVTSGGKVLVGEGPIIPPRIVSSASKEDQENLSMIQHPDEIIIRSMRRCERRLPPLLNEWLHVDAVMTTYEIVLLEVCDILNDNQASSSEEKRISITAKDNSMKGKPSLKQVKKVHKALVATHGGKGLRLRDVICGRKVVGHLLLSSVDVVKVERHKPKKGHVDPGVAGQTSGFEEYWSPHESVQRSPSLSSQRWHHVEEDQFKIHSQGQGFLHLRFFSDLLDYESRALNEGAVVSKHVNLHKNNALLWCQTVVRLRGKSQLKQPLPHFGDNGTDELIDYLEVVDNNKFKHVYARLNSRRSYFAKQITDSLRMDASSSDRFKLETHPEGEKSNSEASLNAYNVV